MSQPMSTNASSHAASQARALGNDLYRAGKLTQADKAYKKAAALAPRDPSPFSNLSAVRYEMGDYEGAIIYAKKALSLISPGTDEDMKKDRLHSRLAKCFLHLLDLSSAKDAISHISNRELQLELTEWFKALQALKVEIPDEGAHRRQIIDRIPRYRPSLQDVPEYFAMGHDEMEMLREQFGRPGSGNLDISFLFAGSGDGRNVFSTILSMSLRDGHDVFSKILETPLRSQRPKASSSRKLHFTLIDLKPAALARVLIFFTLMTDWGAETVQGSPRADDYTLDMAYLFSCQILPPFVEARLQSKIRQLIDRLEGGNDPLDFVFVPKNDRPPLVRVLRQWQRPCAGLSGVSDMREKLQRYLLRQSLPDPLPGPSQNHGSELERRDLKKLSVVLPSAMIAQRRETALVSPMQVYRSTGKSKQLLQYIDSNWKVNNALIDYDFAQVDKGLASLEFDPLDAAACLAPPLPIGGGKTSTIENLARMFEGFSGSIHAMSIEKCLLVELVIGEMADIMERIRHNLLDHRHEAPENRSMLNPTLFPCTYDYMHMSNIPDYVGGHLTTFLEGRPLLKEDRPSSLRFTNLLNPPEFESHEAFQSEYLLMYDMDRIRRHFHLTRRPGEVTQKDLPPMFGGALSPFAFERYIFWDTTPLYKASFPDLMPKVEFEKWIYSHLLKICLPCPRSIISSSTVYSPLNLTTFIRLVVAMFEAGYPAHWLLRLLSSICTGTITTSARPPTKVVSNPAFVDAKSPAQKIAVHPWVPELTTLISIWRRIIPFGVDSLNGLLVPLDAICQYKVTFPPFQARQEHMPHFMLLFWDTEVGSAMKPPDNIWRLLLDGDGGDRSASARTIREKGIVCVTAFHYTSDSRTAVFWMRSDRMEQMRNGKWKVFIWRTDEWTRVTDGLDVSLRVKTGERWTAM